MINNPLITVGIPVYNGGKYLEVAIKSVLNQSFTDFELIIINDGSTDNSQETIDSFSDPRIKAISDGSNKGLISRLNEMIRIANGKYFARMDADDIMFPQRLEVQYNFLESNNLVSLCYSSAVSIDKDNNVLGLRSTALIIDTKEDILNGKTPMHPTVTATTRFFKENLYKEGFFQMEDKELWYRTVEEYRFAGIIEPLLFYREDSSPNSIKHKKMYKGLSNFINAHNIDARKKKKILQSSRAKYWIFKILEALNVEQILLSRRYRHVDTTKYKEVLQKILVKI